MGNLKNNIDHYMELKGIKMYSHLLVDVAHELGIHGKEAYVFASKEKANFSKMLKGERPLKYDFIIPLEKIFGVTLARLLDEGAYKLPVEKNHVPFNKGLRYYAYLDDPKLYREEFDLLLAKDGTSILTHSDEFEKTFLDYVVEYRAINGVRYLHEEYGMKLKWFHNQFEFRKGERRIWIQFENCIPLARLVADMGDVALFNNIYDSYNMFFTNGHYGAETCIFCNSEYLELILDNDDLFESIFQIKPYVVKLSGRDKQRRQIDSVTYQSINPIINNCLRHALNHLDKYKHRAIEMLKFGIDYNRKKVSEVPFDEGYVCNELGGLKSVGNPDYYDIIIFVDVDVNDVEIIPFIQQLPKFKW